MKLRRRRRTAICPPLAVVCALFLLVSELLPHVLPASLLDVSASDEPPCHSELTEPVLPSVVENELLFVPKTPSGSADSKPAVLPVGIPKHQSGSPVYFKNQTEYSIDIDALLEKASPVTLGSEGPQVLILHTHGTEAYTPSPDHLYQASGDYRTIDSRCNVLRVGQEIADRLNERGIATLHSETLHDYPAYNGCYTRALKEIEKIAKEHPSLRLIIDVHRDAIVSGSTYYKTSATVNDQETAQLMMVVGTNAGGLKHDNWRENLTFQTQLHAHINGAFPGMMRPMTIRKGRFNQHVRTGSMLVEVGACGNTLEEALAAADIFAESLADMLLYPTDS